MAFFFIRSGHLQKTRIVLKLMIKYNKGLVEKVTVQTQNPAIKYIKGVESRKRMP